MTENIRTVAPKILEIIKASNNILLHCHPFPDPDSVASALATKAALEQLGKKVTIIRGDSIIPQAFSHFPGCDAIVPKNFFEIMAGDGTRDAVPFDLFIIQDSGSIDRVSSIGATDTGKSTIIFPPAMKTIVIDHHVSNTRFARDINLVEPTYPATALILYDLFRLWNVTLTPDIAGNLLMGIYTDTGGFKYDSVTPDTFLAAAELLGIYPDFSRLISTMENSRRPEELIFQGIALSHIEMFFDGHFALAVVSHDDLKKCGLSAENASASVIASLLKSIAGCDFGAGLVEIDPGKVKVSFRARSSDTADLSVMAVKLGGGGHKAAAAAVVVGTIEEVKKRVISVAGESVVYLKSK
jgi:phosphoesterase RecJ-like protein